MEPQALRRRLRRADLAEGVRRRRRAVQPPGDLPRGDGARGGAVAPRRDRARDGGADDHRARHRGPEAEAPRQDPLDRGDLVPGLLRAGRGLRPLGRADERAARDGRQVLRRRRPEGLVVVRAHRRLVHPRHAQRPGQRAALGTRRTCSSTCTRPASRCARCARSRARPSSTRSSSPASRCRSRTSSATSAPAGRWR